MNTFSSIGHSPYFSKLRAILILRNTSNYVYLGCLGFLIRANALRMLQHPYRMYMLHLIKAADVIRSFANKSLQDLIFVS